MTQHILEEDTVADKKAMQSLFSVIGAFAVATAVLAIAVGMAVG
ncbi:MAG: hypothetical protein ABJL54_07890 [Halioglobus sp.]